jgi:hypothetical protein
VGILDLILAVGNLVRNISAFDTALAGFDLQPQLAPPLPGQPPLVPKEDPSVRRARRDGFVAGYTAVTILPVLWRLVVTVGGFLMYKLQQKTLVYICTIFAMLPCSPACLLGLPFGIWALIVLNRPDVADAFDS